MIVLAHNIRTLFKGCFRNLQIDCPSWRTFNTITKSRGIHFVLKCAAAVFEDTELSRSVKILTVAEGRPIVLRCSHYVSVPRATVTWYSVNATKSRDVHWSLVEQLPVASNERISVDDTGTAYCISSTCIFFHWTEQLTYYSPKVILHLKFPRVYWNGEGHCVTALSQTASLMGWGHPHFRTP